MDSWEHEWSGSFRFCPLSCGGESPGSNAHLLVAGTPIDSAKYKVHWYRTLKYSVNTTLDQHLSYLVKYQVLDCASY